MAPTMKLKMKIWKIILESKNEIPAYHSKKENKPNEEVSIGTTISEIGPTVLKLVHPAILRQHNICGIITFHEVFEMLVHIFGIAK